MLMQLDCGRRSPALLLVAVLVLGGVALPLQAQTNVTAAQDEGAKAPAYEVVSIKLASPDDRNSGWKDLPNGFDFKNGQLFWLIYSAYGITLDSQISGLPAWAKTDHYSVSARVDEDTAEAWKKLSTKELVRQRQLMLQALFAERLQLKMRHEVKELPVYDLVIAKGGLKMKEAAPDEEELVLWKQTAIYSDTSQGDEYTITATTHAGTALGLAVSLTHQAGRIIVDKTGLGEKRFDFELKWSSDQQAPPDGGSAGPSLFKALEEQLGLKLEPAREPVDTFVVEQMERPSAN
jgi:uncharacterized protein (TIGR03435 family)